jgi:hypothetical protein
LPEGLGELLDAITAAELAKAAEANEPLAQNAVEVPGVGAVDHALLDALTHEALPGKEKWHMPEKLFIPPQTHHPCSLPNNGGKIVMTCPGVWA